VTRRTQWLGVGAVLVLAAVLRLWALQQVPGNVFYDAAVRTMGQSWHNFFFGALDPGGSLAVDKPPLDLWLQVASTKVFGFTLFALHLPEALAGVAACALLYGALARPFGARAALFGALALAVLPVSVLTARSDTMDSLLAALQVGALWLAWQALHTRQVRWTLLSAACMGIAFNVKSAQALIALPALALLWLWAAPTSAAARVLTAPAAGAPRAHVKAAPASASAAARARVLGAAAVIFVAVALSWTAIASLTPLRERPFPVGSSNGSIWHVTLIYDGLNRIAGTGASSHGASLVGGAPGPLRLLSGGPTAFATLIGVGLLAALLLGGVALWLGLRLRPFARRERLLALLREPPGRYALAIALWLLLGLLLLSSVRRLQTRYLEMLAPPLCAVLGLSLSALLDLAGRTPRRWGILLGIFTIALFIAGVNSDIELIARRHSDSLLGDPSYPSLSRYLRAMRDDYYYETATANVNDITGLIARDGLPVLVLNDVDGSLTRTAVLRAQVAAGRVRFYFAPHACHSGRHCPGNQLWAYAHSVPVPHLRGLRRFTAPDRTASSRRPSQVRGRTDDIRA
jgi:4-amino-4-deoxy-L-arabinose transferase-like glycosyltransferase